MLETILGHLSAANLPFVVIVVLAAYLVYNKYGTGISKYPGPPLASLSDW